MHILTALTYYRPHYSGLTIYTERLARALAARGHQVTVLTSRFDKNLPAYERVDGVEIVRPRVLFRISKGTIMPGMPWQAWKLIRQADVVNLHVPQLDAAFIAALARLQRKPVVMTYHCDLHLPTGLVHALANRASDLANLLTAGLSNHIVHNTRDYAEHSPFLSRYLDKLTPIYPPVDLPGINQADREAFRRKYEIEPGQRIIGLAARLATEKGVEYLAQALPQVLERYPQARVLCVGPYQNVIGEERYARHVLELVEPLKQHWSFLGVVTDIEMAAFFHECEVLVLPSLNSTESFGIVQVEAMACGAPVVASDLPGMRIPVTTTGAGKLVQPGRADELAAAILAILADPGSYRGQPGSLIHLSTPASVAEQYEALFEKLVAKSKDADRPMRISDTSEAVQHPGALEKYP